MNVLVLGANSDIARALMVRLASRGDHVVLAGRDVQELQITATDLGVRTESTVSIVPFDAADRKSLPALRTEVFERISTIDGLVLAFGYLGDQERAQRDENEVAHIVEINLTAAIAVIEIFARHLEERGSGWILGLSSVAGVRGRRSNYTYGAAKAGFTTILEGLAHRLRPSGVKVKIAKLGFVSSKMTRGLSMPWWAISTPDDAARGLEWLLKSHFQSAFIPLRWWPIMWLIRLLPAVIFNRTRL